VLEKRRDGDMICCQSKPLRRQCSNTPCSACRCVGVFVFVCVLLYVWVGEDVGCVCACVLLYVWVGEDVGCCCGRRHYPCVRACCPDACCAAALPRCRADPPPGCPVGIPAAPLLRCPDAVRACVRACVLPRCLLCCPGETLPC